MAKTQVNLNQQTARNIKWQMATEISARGLQVLATIVLARLLAPADFGLIGMALIFTQLAYVLFDMGLSTALIQKKELETAHYQTAFAVFLAISVVFYLFVFALAPLISKFFNHSQLIAVLRWLGVIFFLYALRAVPFVRLTRQMRFRAIGVVQLLSTIAYAVAAVILAWKGYGVWSFVVGLIVQEAVLTSGTLLVLNEWYIPRFYPQKLNEMFVFGSQVLSSRLVGYVNVNLPNVIIGRWLGASALGFYSVAYQLVDFPVQRIAKNILRVMFPAFSRVQDDAAQFLHLFNETVRGLTFIVFPVFAGMVLVAPEFVKLFYGLKWLPLISILQILTIVGLARSLWVICSVIFLARGKPKTELLINLSYFLFLTPALYLAHTRGLTMVVWTIAVLISLFTVLFILFSVRLLKLKIGQWLALVRVPLISTVLMFVLTFALKNVLLVEMNGAWRFGLTLISGGVFYLLAIFLLDRQLLIQLKKLVKAKV